MSDRAASKPSRSGQEYAPQAVMEETYDPVPDRLGNASMHAKIGCEMLGFECCVINGAAGFRICR
jgi:hypothetical protein